MSEIGVNRPNILIVDDIPENITLLAELLKSDYAIRATTQGKQALTIAQRSPQPDLILLDVMMPDMDGFEICQALKFNPATHDIPVMFITANSGPHSENKGFQFGAVDYIFKPFNPHIVRTRIAAQLASSLRLRQLSSLVDCRKTEIEVLRHSLMKKLHHHARQSQSVANIQLILNDEERTYLASVLGSTFAKNGAYKPTILVVDDDPNNIDILADILSTDYTIKAVTRGPQAIHLVQKTPLPDMILLDIMMPEMDGFDVCRELKGRPDTAQIPIIFVTSKTEDAYQFKGFELGAVDYITKPYHPRLIRNRIAAQLSLSLQRQKLASQARNLAEEITSMRHTLSDTTAEEVSLADPLSEVQVELTEDELSFLTDVLRAR